MKTKFIIIAGLIVVFALNIQKIRSFVLDHRAMELRHENEIGHPDEGGPTLKGSENKLTQGKLPQTIEDIDREIERRNLIERANAQLLSEDEFKDLEVLINHRSLLAEKKVWDAIKALEETL